MAKKQKKGKVYLETSKGIYPLDVFRKAQSEAIQKDSKQVKEKQSWQTADNLISPPYPPESFLLLYEHNPIYYRCVNQIAIDVAGLGWNLHLRDGKKDNNKEYDRLYNFLTHPNPDESIREIFKQLLIDWGTIGYFGIEVVNKIKNEISEIYHVPAHTFRIHIDKEKFCQCRNNKKVWFKKFGLEGNINSKDGKDADGFSLETNANELIYYKNYYPKSDYYGAPNILPATGDVIGLIGCRDYNLAFFENYGIPSGIVTLEGEWEDGSEEKISQFLNKHHKGSENAHKTMVLTQPPECNFKYDKITADVKEGSFKIYETIRREDVLTAYSMPPERIGIQIVGKLGGNIAQESTKIYIQSVVEPLQRDIEAIVNNKLLQSEIYEFKFEDIDIRDYDAEVKRLIDMVHCGMKTPNEARQEIGLDPYPEGDKFYMESALIEAGEPAEPLSKEEDYGSEETRTD